ncbi:MAG: DUF4433 domain-containing protein [Gemmatimonadetes bacterium]|nr:DUF4433 domain-containing protein [Gemmatimonadota bacterium]
MLELNAHQALIFRITHLRNVPWLLRHGICCRSHASVDPQFVEIGNPDLIAKRPKRTVPIPPGGNLSDYVPFYFTPYSPMLYNILTGYGGITRRDPSEVVILVGSLRRVAEQGISYVFTDRHAYLVTARFFNDLAQLDQIDWPLLQARDFRRNGNDPGKFERYQAEALVHGVVPVGGLLGIACADGASEGELNAMTAHVGLDLPIAVRRAWYP